MLNSKKYTLDLSENELLILRQELSRRCHATKDIDASSKSASQLLKKVKKAHALARGPEPLVPAKKPK